MVEVIHLRLYEVCSCIHLKCLRILYWVLGVSHDILDGKRHVFLFPPRILHGFVHPGKILRHFEVDARTDFRGEGGEQSLVIVEGKEGSSPL